MKQDEKENKNEFIIFLKKLKREKNLAAMAHLRRGLGKPAGTTTEMYPYIGSFLRKEPDYKRENALYLVGSLFGFYWKAENTKGNLGDSMFLIKDESGSIEKRFAALLNANYEDLHHHLRQAVSLLKSKEKPINWERLFQDIRNWESDDRKVQREWARGFWDTNRPKNNQENGETEIENEGEEK